jgi:hypothetical protein
MDYANRLLTPAHNPPFSPFKKGGVNYLLPLIKGCGEGLYKLFSNQNLFFGLCLIHYIIKIVEAMDQWVKAGTVENRFEGDRISQALHEAGIPFLIKSFLDTAYDGLYIPQKGWGIVMVSEKNREETERLIGEIKKTFVKEEENETG